MDRLGGIRDEATSFVGRRSELVEVRRLLSTGRLVTLIGVGGAGKTRLALRAAAQSRRAFGDGAWWVELASLAMDSLIEHPVAEALGIQNQTNRPVGEMLAEHLRERQLLLVLDNCEHLLDTCARFAITALGTAPGLRILCTSRQSLGVVGEQLWIVSPMRVPDQTQPPPASAGPRSESLALFAERAAAVVPGFALLPDNTDRVVEICRRLDGLPLAIELAAAQLRTLSVEQLAAVLRDRSRRLAARHATPAHHRTLAAMFDWSYELCSPPEQTLWRRMSVFVDSFELAAIEYVGADRGTQPVPESVAGLIDKSVLGRKDADGRMRYRILETVRQYGLDRVRTCNGEETTLRRRHRDWYLSLAERFDSEWFGPDQRQWSTRMRHEHPNLRAALDFSLTTPHEQRAGAGIAADLLYSWYGSGLLHEGRYWLDRALTANPEPTTTRIKALAAYSRITQAQGDLAAAESTAREYLDLAARLDEPSFVPRATADLGAVALLANDLSRAQGLLEQALARFTERAEYGTHVAVAQTAWAMTMLYQGDTDRAAAICAECRAACEARGEQHWRAFVLVASALVARAQDDHAAAIAYLGESVRLRRPLGDTLGLAGSIEQLAWTAADTGDYHRAAGLLGAADRLWQMIGRTFYGASPWFRGREECQAVTRKQLGESAYQRALRRGVARSTDEAVSYALEEDQPPAATPETTAAQSLTPRERQIAHLAAQGLSNKQIAARLVVSQRTAESHVENILRKLGFTSRTQIATWIPEQDA